MFCVHQGEPQEIIKPVPITHPSTCTTYTKPTSHSSPAYNTTARPFGASSTGVTASLSPEAPKVATIPSASSAFTPAAPSQLPQPPFPLRSSPAAPDAAPSTFKPSPGRSTFTSPYAASSSSSSSDSSSPARGTAPPSTQSNVPPPSVYNTPINLYSNANACEVAMGQRRGLLESQGLSEHLNGYVPSPLLTTCFKLHTSGTTSTIYCWHSQTQNASLVYENVDNWLFHALYEEKWKDLSSFFLLYQNLFWYNNNINNNIGCHTTP